MAHMIESMAYRGEKPWHKLGTVIPDNVNSVQEVLDIAGLSNWDLKTRPLFFVGDDGKSYPVDRCAVIRGKDGKVVGDAVGMDFNPVQIEKAFSVFDPYIKAGCQIETAGSIRDGRRVWMLAKINKPDSVIVPQADDRVEKYLLCAMGHDSSLSFRVGYTPIRVVCNNTLQMALGNKKSHFIKVKHTKNANSNIDAIRDQIEAVNADFEKTAEIYRALAAVSIKNEAQIKAYIKAVFSQKDEENQAVTEAPQDDFAALLQRPAILSDHTDAGKANLQSLMGVDTRKSRVEDDIIRLFHQGAGNDLPGVRGTAWGLYNAVTHYNSHERGGTGDWRAENRLNSNWMQPAGPIVNALPMAMAQFLNHNA